MIIDIKRYPVFMKLGVFKEEQIMGQEVLVSLRAQIDCDNLSLIKDELGRTLDYGKLISALDEILEDKAFKLVETAVDRVGTGLMQKFVQIHSLDIAIEKPLLPSGLGKGAKVSIEHSFHRGLAC